MQAPIYIDVFFAVIRDNSLAQVATVAILLLILLDVVFGVGNALSRKEYKSNKMREGINHKCAEMGYMLVGIIVDGSILGGFDLGYTAPVYTGVCVYLAIMEIGSLMETFSIMYPQLAHSPVFNLLAIHSEKEQ